MKNMHEVKYQKIETGKYHVIFNGKIVGEVEKCESASRSFWACENWTVAGRPFHSSDKLSNWGPGKCDSTRDNCVYDAFFGNQ